MDFTGRWRTNYCRYTNLAGLIELAALFSVDVYQREDETVGFGSAKELDPARTPAHDFDNEQLAIVDRILGPVEAEEELRFGALLAEQLKDHEVLVEVSVGYEGMRDFIGFTRSATNRGDLATVKLDEIYERTEALVPKGTPISRAQTS
jgi:hypothetical protein